MAHKSHASVAAAPAHAHHASTASVVGGVDWSALSGAAPSLAPSTLLAESVFSANLTVHSLLREVHVLTLERHTAAAQGLALQAQVAALEANLADSVRMQGKQRAQPRAATTARTTHTRCERRQVRYASVLIFSFLCLIFRSLSHQL